MVNLWRQSKEGHLRDKKGKVNNKWSSLSDSGRVWVLLRSFEVGTFLLKDPYTIFVTVIYYKTPIRFYDKKEFSSPLDQERLRFLTEPVLQFNITDLWTGKINTKWRLDRHNIYHDKNTVTGKTVKETSYLRKYNWLTPITPMQTFCSTL